MTPTPTIPGSESGGVPTGFSASISQTLSNSQLFGPQFGVTLSTAGSGGGYSTAASNSGVNTANRYVGVNGTGLMEALPAMDVDLAFTPAIDLTATSPW